MHHFFEMIDLGENLRRGLNAIRSLTGLPALLTAIPLAMVATLFLSLAWHFDIRPTYDWTQIAVRLLQPTVPASFNEALPLLVLALTLLPTLIELFTVRFARYNITLAQWLVYFFVVFDWVTDWPTTSAFIDGYVASGVFSQLGLFATPTIIFTKVMWLIFASFGFEMLGVVFAICTLGLLLNARRTHGGVGAGPVIDIV